VKITPCHLESVFESNQTLNGLATSIHSLVCTMELDAKTTNNENNHGIRKKCCQHSGAIVGCVLGSKDGRANDSTNGSTTHKGSRGKGSFPLASDVVGLVGEKRWAVGIALKDVS
jgi:hypothetical protein